MSNLFEQFRRVLAIGAPLQVGTVTAIHAGGATVELPGGGVLQARGETTLGQKVYMRDGVIEGAAPDLPIEVIDV